MRAQCLLECFYGERLTATAQSFSDSITSDEFTCQASPQHLERSLQSDELSKRGYCQAGEGDNIFQMIENHPRHDPLNGGQMQAIRILGANLRIAADCMQIRPTNSFLDVNPTALIKEGLSCEEIQVVRRIYTERASITIYNIARHLQECLTSQTFRMALLFLSNSTSSVSEELAAACELARLIYPRVQEAIQAGPVYDVLQEFIENKLDEILH